MHGGGNVLVLLLFVAGFLLRDRDYAPQLSQMAWSVAFSFSHWSFMSAIRGETTTVCRGAMVRESLMSGGYWDRDGESGPGPQANIG
jgi:hypothetical protein